MAIFKTALRLVGLSQKEAAEYFDVSEFSISSYRLGRKNPKLQVWVRLNKLQGQIADAVKVGVQSQDNPEDTDAEKAYHDQRSALPAGAQEAVEAAVHIMIVGRAKSNQ